ncbi:Acetyltransferase (GNAT) domain-containing protein [Micromonospora phaseoli]|uniref:Acetyltransferase (GNAT) domain-containing protein n=1 Tax=Micromonospora phaseoli TaxID=1144548 RepID=A0A1H6ZIG7_9ACTN|nr:GNAT family N-acetyltransferase [Micromonospora phaseoli]PZV97273.1 acetyltransferase (GNAT) family protein [Micromonospora phaseoli]GIJ80375.1 N-acetyltransferase [Micromonospora phaseoli]SEJ51317.1 Acetyltransferase (GNAT) domain-containing protein [Micromonospora phaseoli]
MDATARIRAGRWAEKDKVAALIADALHPDPLAAWLVPEATHRRRILTEVAAIWVEHAMFYGDTYVTDDLNAAAVGFHRYRSIPPPANYCSRLTDAAGHHAERFEILDGLLIARRPTEPHYHLAFLAVAPVAQRQGIGAAMLAHHRDRLDHVDLPSWTDTTGECQDVYTRYGYTPQEAIRVPASPAITPMRRTPTSGPDPLDTVSAAGGSQASGLGI